MGPQAESSNNKLVHFSHVRNMAKYLNKDKYGKKMVNQFK